MVSRCLVEACAENSKPKGFEDIVPMLLHTYANVFSEMAFDSLPEHCKWDHAINLECELSPRFRKVSPMTLTEQTEMDAFLEEALATGCIRQSKSLLRALVFFIKRKDGKLRFIQDYQALDAIVRGYLPIFLLLLSFPPLFYTPLFSPTLTPVHMYTPPLSVPLLDAKL
jgi:hypothetical protein